MPEQREDVVVRVEERKSTTVAYLLWFFLGGVGAHRFYLGRPGSAVGMLALNFLGWPTLGIGLGFLLLGAFAIWWVVDVFLIPGMVSAAPHGALVAPVVNVNISQSVNPVQEKEEGEPK